MTIATKADVGTGSLSQSGRIIKAECILVAVPFQLDAKPVWAFTSAPANTFDTLFVRLETDTGLVGWGEAFSRTEDRSLKNLIETRILPLVIGEEARRIGKIKHKLEYGLQNFGRVGPTMYAISAIDIALWDIAGKAAGAPLVDLLGGPFGNEVEVYASLLRYDSEEGVAAAVRRAIAEGYSYIKLHEIRYREIAAACAAAAGHATVMLDVNCPWSVAEALAMDARLAGLDLLWLEEPVWPPDNYRGLARVRAARHHRIAAGENAGSLQDFVAMADAGAIDIAQPDVAKTGGVTELMKIAAFCEASAIEFVPHCALFGPGQIATLHINAAQRTIPFLERLYCQFEAELYNGATLPVHGKLTVPTAPGLGIEPDPTVIDRYRVI
ncbi:L-alanine-DL-glutamate epimerase-like enolase superfamily enzyme [Bradyrhizobium sp. USDA 4524]|uniref:mandelate racemase/muconate lactonizing enzyme family protein n=1 Tax=unclassified Bradyrhizobium TaxID=2631580 RepID=UPI0020A0AD40|nr:MULTISPECIES: mandelate racemase/muconate lactonizing enzyme family protein [unclassified Bradyrhizobium]MCP1845824.1 L-alanine-DL-glutamate epimerase-like enolase superfamily enzyme [Bradyrhizobium sp. USDA 4538]MCP1906853.1 L-alanine-DL-glutamate epimerase-like enolase superfamily enzyme [Bradyrhizobium sp. USDA 4537]MCP1985328.1 L-alanine-DL-glutamate epimerase-like enolase superfamily enzyme [Bradyrhizobium sp. USDA 4539]